MPITNRPFIEARELQASPKANPTQIVAPDPRTLNVRHPPVVTGASEIQHVYNVVSRPVNAYNYRALPSPRKLNAFDNRARFAAAHATTGSASSFPDRVHELPRNEPPVISHCHYHPLSIHNYTMTDRCSTIHVTATCDNLYKDRSLYMLRDDTRFASGRNGVTNRRSYVKTVEFLHPYLDLRKPKES